MSRALSRGFWRQLRETGKDTCLLSAAKNVGQGYYSFRQYKAYADIRGSSLERRSNDSRVFQSYYARKAYITITIRLRYDCDTTTIRLRRKIGMFIFCSRRMEAVVRDTS